MCQVPAEYWYVCWPTPLDFLHRQMGHHPASHSVGMSFRTKVFNFSLVVCHRVWELSGCAGRTARLVSYIAPHKSRPASVSVTLTRPWVMAHKSPNPNCAAKIQLARQYLFYFKFFARDVTKVKCECKWGEILGMHWGKCEFVFVLNGVPVGGVMGFICYQLFDLVYGLRFFTYSGSKIKMVKILVLFYKL